MCLFEVLSCLDTCPEVRLPDHVAVLFLVSRKTSIVFPIVVAPIYIPPTNSVGGFSFLHTLSSICILLFLTLAFIYYILEAKVGKSSTISLIYPQHFCMREANLRISYGSLSLFLLKNVLCFLKTYFFSCNRG